MTKPVSWAHNRVSSPSRFRDDAGHTGASDLAFPPIQHIQKGMDKLPKLRRKPKPPAIKTAVDRPVVGVPGETSTAVPDSANQNHQHLHGAEVPQMQMPSMRKSPLRNLKLRVSAKRARTNSPAPRPSSSPVVAVFNQDGFAPRSAMDESMSFNGHHSSRPMMPAFLNTTLHGMFLRPRL